VLITQWVFFRGFFMLNEMFRDVVNIVAGIFAGFLLLRFWMQVLRVRPPSSLGQSIYQITDWIVKPIRRFVPGFMGLDWASLIASYLVAVLAIALEMLIVGQMNLTILFVMAFLHLVQWILYGLTALLFLEAILSFVNPHAPLAPIIRALNQPILAPLRRLIPSIGGFDFSIFVALIILHYLGRVVTEKLPLLFF
jgi:YggT family protein